MILSLVGLNRKANLVKMLLWDLNVVPLVTSHAGDSGEKSPVIKESSGKMAEIQAKCLQ